ncbi:MULTISPECIES: lateral flagellar basal-body rod protein LfgF [Aeromonas]|uniref:lateral flagellar basal-body rod protein LfgF n=1 Tax=Aeromonas TaxID=642 RepID=UPI0003A8A2E1|nr:MULTISPECIES: lateral flagellar basal-body rod protein LfgF [Aeromonas]AMQ41451.1 flagellar biosynthesis protein FlgF [Aeromonas veronii]ANB67575.1 flagellar biosynthesis protein FlgF [Aeromonas veronii]EKP0293659.1 lateral flagellar basal-body rod protein LfgF [Aeromonas veronii]MBM0418514.1 flagellar basal-body rod protein FlgF [Aeromonas veronii]MBW3781010.1 flagellar basal-body rod protein FlgF [Aeromonas veronii]
MEKLIYTAMSGAQHTLMAQQIRANNLANVNTAGFRADFERVSAYALTGDGYQSRVMAKEEMAGTNFKAGPLMQTGRKLDVAIRGEGFLAVQTEDGKEAYTRAGNLEADADGLLTLNGRPVLGEGGELVLPAYRDISFGKDGTLSITPPGGGARLDVGRLKLVNPEPAELVKGHDGLFRMRQGEDAEVSDQVVMASGFLEGANVNAVDELVSSMSLTRNFELQVKLMKAADDQARQGAKLISGQG